MQYKLQKDSPLKFRKLGRSDLEVSLIGLGTMTWGSQNTEQEAHEQIDYALDQGVNFLDTAELYPVPPKRETHATTETYIGNWLEKTGRRKDVVLASKIAGLGFSHVREGKNKVDGKNLKPALHDSLKRLKTDYLDLYQLHWPNRPFYHFQKHWHFKPTDDSKREIASIVEVLETLQGFIKEGKIRHFGLSNETAWGMMTFIHQSEKLDLPRPVSIQNEYSLLCRLFEPDLHEIALAEDCGLLAWSPLCRGILSGKYLDGKMPKGSRLSIDPREERRTTKQYEEATRSYVDLAKEQGLDPCQMALAFVNSRPFVTSTLIGATSMDQLKTNIGSIDIELSSEVEKAIQKIWKLYPIPWGTVFF